ncbi:response regulator [candidate division WOR-3 bacterium]|nr:response regulator [candidate division WOR-3 bacterium]
MKATADMLGSRGYVVKAVASAEDGLEMLKAQDFDLVITDYSMPGLDGVDFINKIRKIKPNQKIIVVSGFPSQYAKRQAFKAGALYYIVKPFAVDLLLDIINEVINEVHDIIGSIQLTLEELIHLYALGERTLLLEIQSGGEVGQIYFRKGEIIHADTGKLRGEEAFYKILSYKTGVFITRTYRRMVSRTIDLCTNALILEGARLWDEKLRAFVSPNENERLGRVKRPT